MVVRTEFGLKSRTLEVRELQHHILAMDCNCKATTVTAVGHVESVL